MTKIISIHEYELKPGVEKEAFEKAIRAAEKRNVLHLPGLNHYYMVKGIRGSRTNRYAAIWIYEDRQSWERIWGLLEEPKTKDEYPENWQIWEDEILAPFLTQEPDKITYTVYEEW